MGKKNDVAFIIQDILCSYEQQSSFNPNMPVRQLIYIAKLYEKYIQINKYNVFSGKLIKLPKPKLVVFFNGNKDTPDTMLNLADAFINQNDEIQSDISVNVQMLNINYNENKDILKKCRPLWEYSWLIDKIRYYGLDNEILEAVNKALDDMDDNFQIKTFLIAHKAEVQDMLFTEYNEEETMKAIRQEMFEDAKEAVYEEAKAKGLAEGKAEGLAVGIAVGIAVVLKAAEDGLIPKEVAEMLTSRMEL